MKTSKSACFALVAALSASAVCAQTTNKDSGHYAELGYLPLNMSDGTYTVKPQMARFMVGTEINENLSVEGMVGATVSKDKQAGVDYSSTAYGLFLKPKMEVATATQIFARVGYVHTSLDARTANARATAYDSSVAYGLGVQTQFTKDVYGQLDYMDYYRKDNQTVKGFTVSVGMRF